MGGDVHSRHFKGVDGPRRQFRSLVEISYLGGSVGSGRDNMLLSNERAGRRYEVEDKE